MRNTQKGFTLIELLVVIAIIGILSTIVLTSLGSARNKANDTKVQGQLSGMRAAAESYYSTNNTYDNGTNGICNPASGDTSGLAGLLLAANYPGGVAPTCNDSASAWAAAHVLPSYSTTTYFCVDSTGAAKTTTTALGTDTDCP